VQLWDVRTGQKLLQLMGHLKRTQSIVFSADGRLVIAGGSYGTVNIWETATGKHLVTLFAFSDPRNSAGTGDWVADIIRRHQTRPIPFSVVSCPEFLREGSAISDFMQPHRTVLGSLDPEAAEILVLKYVHSYKDVDIAKVIGTSRGAIAMRLLRSRSRLKKLMRDLSGEKK